jgi:uncharacterized tellurite resistance protein B-like protein
MATKQEEREARALSIFKTHSVESQTPFNLEKLSDKFRHRVTDWSIPQAFLCLLISAAMADGHFDTEEEEAIRSIARRSRALNALPPNDLAAANDLVNERLQNRSDALKEACDTLPADMTLPVFAHCVDIILADGELLKNEADFLQGLVPMLDIEPENARRVMEVLLLKNQF